VAINDGIFVTNLYEQLNIIRFANSLYENYISNIKKISKRPRD